MYVYIYRSAKLRRRRVVVKLLACLEYEKLSGGHAKRCRAEGGGKGRRGEVWVDTLVAEGVHFVLNSRRD